MYKIAESVAQFSKLHFTSCLFTFQLWLPAARTQTKTSLSLYKQDGTIMLLIIIK